MKAQYAMTRNIVCMKVDDTVEEAQGLMQEWSIRHLPVLDEEELVGIISDRDLIAAEPETLLSDVMTKKPITCHTGTSLATVAETMLAEKIDCIPVLDDDGELTGMITSSDFIQYVLDKERLALTHPMPFHFQIHRAVRPGMMAALVSSSSL